MAPSVVIPIGYNATPTINVSMNGKKTVVSPLDFVQGNTKYITKTLESKFNNFFDYLTIVGDVIKDTRFPELGHLFRSHNILKYRKEYQSHIDRLLYIGSISSIHKIYIYNTHRITPYEALRLYNSLKTFNNNFSLIVVITAEDNIQLPVVEGVKFYLAKDTFNINGDIDKWREILNEEASTSLSYSDMMKYYPEIDLHHPIKKIRVAILLSGQWRCNQTNITNYPIDDRCGLSFNRLIKFISNKLIEEKNVLVCEPDIFICTDNFNVNLTYDTYKGIKLSCLMDCKRFIGDFEGYDFKGEEKMLVDAAKERMMMRPEFEINVGMVMQWYKLYMAHKMMENYENKNNIRYDLIMRIRPDAFFKNDVTNEQINELCNGGEILQTDGDWYAFGTRKIMDRYCSLIHSYGSYIFMDNVRDFDFNAIWYKKNYYEIKNIERWTYSPEVQLCEHLIDSGLNAKIRRVHATELSNHRKK